MQDEYLNEETWAGTRESSPLTVYSLPFAVRKEWQASFVRRGARFAAGSAATPRRINSGNSEVGRRQGNEEKLL